MTLTKKEKEALGYAGAMTGAVGAIAATEAISARQENKRRNRGRDIQRQRGETRKEKTSQGRNKARKAAAETRLAQLQKIKPSNLSTEDRKVRTAYINEQKNILKDLKPKTAASIAKSVGLKSIPGIGAFIGMFSSTPAYNQGGKVHRGRKADGSKA